MADVLFSISIIGAIILVGFLGNVLFKKTSVPSTLWLIIFGMVLSFLGLAGTAEAIDFAGLVGAIAIIAILSDGGMSLNLKEVLAHGHPGWLLLMMGLVSSMFSSIVVLGLFGFPLEIGLLVGLIIAGTSSSVVIPIMVSLRVSDRIKSILSIESIADTFSILFALLLMEFLSGEMELLPGTLLQAISSELISAIFIGGLLGFALASLIVRLRKHEFFYSALLGALLLLYVFAETFGANGALAIFSAGLIIGNAHVIQKAIFPRGHFEKMDRDVGRTHSLIAFLIRVFFFVFLGMLVGLPDTRFLLIGFIVVTVVLLVRIAYIHFLSKAGMVEFSLMEKRLASIIIPRGLSAAVLSTFAYSFNLPFAGEVVQIVFSIILFSIVFTTAGVFVSLRDTGAHANVRRNFRGAKT